MNSHKLHILISRTDTFVGATIRRILGGDLNHCSVAFDDDFSSLYSFSRLYQKLWFTGCFCCETTDRYSSYEVFTINITDDDYNKIMSFISELKQGYRVYDYIGAFLLLFNISMHFRHNFICSTFAAKCLSLTDTVHLDKSCYLYRPMELYNLLSDNK